MPWRIGDNEEMVVVPFLQDRYLTVSFDINFEVQR
jgi:hypothetical protein